jgi:hypothetical protein
VPYAKIQARLREILGPDITPELAAAIKEHKADIIRILREDEEMTLTGIIQSERQVFELAREFFSLNEQGEG